ncbi:MAG: hypothetical protein ATN36_05560 [Epulopiscium sp. Nele67-Bin005]|nr:MAG: hypothetical protein ATN36_05560 [Epulopiscium sp. Nele67-Bin005]
MSKQMESSIRPPMGGPGGPPKERAKLKNSKATINRIWAYLAGNKPLLIFTLFLILINSVFTIMASYMIRPIINGLTENAGFDVLMSNLMIMAFVYIIAVISSYLQSRLMLEISQKALEKIRYDLFEKMQQLPLKFFDTNNNGDLMSRFTNDIDAMNQMLATTCVQLISGVTTLFATILIMFYTNWILTIVTLVVTPLFNSIIKKISHKSMNYYKEQQQAIGDLNGYIEERISGQKVIKVFNHEAQTIEEFKKLNDEYREKSFKAQFISGMMGPVTGSLTQLSYTIVAGVGGLLCIFRGFDIGGYTIFLNYSRSFSRPINDIFMQINTLFSALAGAERVFEVIDTEPEVADTPDCITIPEIKGEVTLQNVHFGYEKDSPILKDISLVAKPSQKIAFVGSTGAGKTTVTNLLNRFYDIQSGEILIDNVPINKIRKQHLRENIAMVLQDTNLSGVFFVCLFLFFLMNLEFLSLHHRTTSDLESFLYHVLMYGGKWFACSTPLYEARILLAALDYNRHNHWPVHINQKGKVL